MRRPDPLPNPSPGGRGAQGAEDLGRLRWRCRRGTRELDALLTWYLAQRFVDADADDRSAFERLLEAQDPDIYDWCMGRAAPPDAGIAVVIDAIRAHHFV